MRGHLDSYKSRTSGKTTQTELDKRVLELSALFEISKTLNSSHELHSILDNILLVPMGRMMISRGIILFQETGERFKTQHVKGLAQSLLDQSVAITPFPETPLLINSLNSDAAYISFFKENKIELLIPLTGSMHFKGLLGFGKKLTGKPFNEEEIQFLSSLSNIAAQSIENTAMLEKLNKANRSLDQKVQELNTLFEIGRELNQIFDRAEILKQLSYSLMGQLLVNQFFVALKHGDKLRIEYRKGSKLSQEKLKDCDTICASVQEITVPIIIGAENEYSKLQALGIRLIVPMIYKNQTSGFIFLGDKLDQSPFSKTNLSFLSTLANMVIISLENSSLIQEMIEKKRMEEELNFAKTIQRQLLPAEMPDIPAYDIHGLNIPSRQVGGDYFDIIPLREDEYLFTVADVSGKGMPAALLMSNLQAALHSLSGEQYSLNQATAKLNNLIHRNTTIEKYITFFVLILNIRSGVYSFVNAGHNPPYLFREKDPVLPLEEGGIILGMMPDVPYKTGNGQIKPGECIVMFTDGVTEAANAEEEEFAEEGVINFFEKHFRQHSSEQLNTLLLEELNRFSNGDPARADDITILTIKALA